MDFSSSLYLNMQHRSGEIGGWATLGAGFPAAFSEAPAAVLIARQLAALQGLEDGLIAPSTLHLFWDWFGGLHPSRHCIFADEHLYLVAGSGIERAIGKGVPAFRFRHHAPDNLAYELKRRLRPGIQPIVVTDGWCPFCGKPAPIGDYLKLVETYDGLLVLDDTQALGLLGANSSPGTPFGHGGGGLLRHLDLRSPRVIVIASLAKAFGVPLAVICGSSYQMSAFRALSETRVFGSPPSAAALSAAINALGINAVSGEQRRARLLHLIRLFRARMMAQRIHLRGGLFPVQSIVGLSKEQVWLLHHDLKRRGICTVPIKVHGHEPRLCWVINTRHTVSDIENACRIFSERAHLLQPKIHST
jgi:8-amino-7-oxononanoate synthase